MLQNIIRFAAEPATGSGFSFGSIFAASLDPLQVFFTFLLALIIGVIIFLVYKATFAGVMYSRSFNISLIMLTLVTSLMLLLITSNLALSLGMVGALSIIRFRTAVKDPMDTAYMFWSLTMGILLGAELYVHALAVVLGISVILMLMTFIRFRNPNSYLLVVHYDDYAEQEITQLLRRAVRQRKLRSKTVTRSGAEMTVEVRLDSKQDLVSAVLNIEGVHDATLVACQVEAGT